MTTEHSKDIERLATGIMGWYMEPSHLVLNIWNWEKCGGVVCIAKDESSPLHERKDGWSPFTNWNHTHQVEQAIMEDGKGELCKKYLACWDSKAHYISSGREERMNFVISVLPKDDE